MPKYRTRLRMTQIQARRASEWIGRLLVHSLARRVCHNVPILAAFDIAQFAPRMPVVLSDLSKFCDGMNCMLLAEASLYSPPGADCRQIVT